MRSGRPTASRRLAAARPAKALPQHVTTGEAPATQRVARRGVRVVGERVEKEVGKAKAGQMVGDIVEAWSEDEAIRIDLPGGGSGAKVPHDGLVPPRQPHHAAFDRVQQAHPRHEYRRRDLGVVVETAVHTVPRSGRPAPHAREGIASAIRRCGSVTMKLFTGRWTKCFRCRTAPRSNGKDDPVGQDVVDEFDAHCPGIAEHSRPLWGAGRWARISGPVPHLV